MGKENMVSLDIRAIESNLDKAITNAQYLGIDQEVQERLKEMRVTRSWRGFAERQDGTVQWARE